MLSISSLSLSRGGKTLFSDVAFALAPGHRMGVTGPNGCGKSSLFAVIHGQVEQDTGEIDLPESWRIATVLQESPTSDESALEFVLAANQRLYEVRSLIKEIDAGRGSPDNAAALHQEFDSLDGYSATARAGRLLAGLGFTAADQDKPVVEFSGGWRARLALARALFRPSDLLMLDEPTNHLDIEAIVWLEGWLKRYEGVVLLISHDRTFLDAVTTHTAYYENGQVAVMTGNYSDTEAKRAQILEQQAAEFKKQRGRAKELQNFVDRFRYKASKARQAQSRLKMLERLTASAPAHARSGYSFEFPDPDQVSTPLMNMENAAVGYGGEPVLSDITLSLLPGDRIGLLGRNGAGKSTLVKLLTGELAALGGERHDGRHLRIGYFAQHQLDQFDYRHSPLELLAQIAGDTPEQRLRDFLGSFGFHGDMAVEPIAPRSGGEKARLALALLAWQRPSVLVMDEPTNHLDLEMRHALTVALQSYAGAMVLVSHDRSLLTACCDEFLLIHDGGVHHFPGDLDDYTRVLRERESAASAADGDEPSDSQAGGAPVSNRKDQRRLAAQQRERLKPLRSRVKKLEAEIDTAHHLLEQIRTELADPTLYESENTDRIAELNRSGAEAQREIERIETEWMDATEALESASSADESD